jgi:hypothetical protein
MGQNKTDLMIVMKKINTDLREDYHPYAKTWRVIFFRFEKPKFAMLMIVSRFELQTPQSNIDFISS